jgi:ergothioneine biosynthesis protein EgtB
MSPSPHTLRPVAPAQELVARRFQSVRQLTETLAAALSAEDQTAQSIPEVSPTKWHRAHTTWFFETFVLERHEPDFVPVHRAYRMLFNSYYETVGEQYPRPRRGVITRPGIEEIAAYRTQVDDRVRHLVCNTNTSQPDHQLISLVELGIHHEQQHQELLLMDIKHVLSLNPLEPAYRLSSQAPSPGTDPGFRWVSLHGGLVEVGRPGDESPGRFSFDNERPRHLVYLEPFQLADRLVTAAQWQAFIDDGGYQRPELWLSDGWHTVHAQAWAAPLYWRRRDNGWWIHTLAGSRPVTDAEPVCHISFYEADAFARWAGARLPTEFEWEHAASSLPSTNRPFDLERLHPFPAIDHPSAALSQLIGDCWQWTASAYSPYPGFAAEPGAVGEYNGKFMSGQMVLRGGCALTPPGHTRPTYRNFFPPAARWPMAGLRLASGEPPQ